MRHALPVTLAPLLSLALLLPGCSSSQPHAPQAALPPDQSAQLATAKSEPTPSVNANRLDTVSLFTGPMPTGVTVSADNRVFLCFPRWADPVESTVAELRNGQLLPYPDAAINRLDKPHADKTLVSVQSVVVDPKNRLWLLDTGDINMGKNLPNAPKLLCVDLNSNRVTQTIHFPDSVALPHTYLNDVRFDLTRGTAGLAYITDSSTTGDNGLIIVDLATGQSWRKLNHDPSTLPQPGFVPVVEGQPLLIHQGLSTPKPPTIGSDGIALSPDGKTLYYRPLISHHLYSVPTDMLADRNIPEDRVASSVRDLGDLGFASDGILCDSRGLLYLTDYEHHAVRRGDPSHSPFRPDILVSDPRLIWPDTLSLGPDGFLYITSNQLNRQSRFRGQDLRRPPTPSSASPPIPNPTPARARSFPHSLLLFASSIFHPPLSILYLFPTPPSRLPHHSVPPCLRAFFFPPNPPPLPP